MTTPTQLRRDVDALTALAQRDLAALWNQVTNAAEARQALEDVLPALIQTYGLAAGALAADWYDAAREKAGVGGTFRARVIEPRAPGARKLAEWSIGQATDLDNALTLAQGGVQRRIANVARGSVIASTASDRRAVGWMRVGAGACPFCQMLIARGAVYTEATARFASHDNCNCQAAPKWPGAEPIDVEKFRASQRRRSAETTEKDRARVRQWITENEPGMPAVPTF